MPNCQNCQEKCPQAEMANEVAKGRMYATNEFIALLKKVESGQLVEVVRCRDCKHWDSETWFCDNHSTFDHHGLEWNMFSEDDFCSYGERKDGDGNG